MGSEEDDVGFWECFMWVIFFCFYGGFWLGCFEFGKECIFNAFDVYSLEQLEEEFLKEKLKRTRDEKDFDKHGKNTKYVILVNERESKKIQQK